MHKEVGTIDPDVALLMVARLARRHVDQMATELLILQALTARMSVTEAQHRLARMRTDLCDLRSLLLQLDGQTAPEAHPSRVGGGRVAGALRRVRRRRP